MLIIPDAGICILNTGAVPNAGADDAFINCKKFPDVPPLTKHPYKFPADAFATTAVVTVELLNSVQDAPDAADGSNTEFTAITPVPVGAVPSDDTAAVRAVVLSVKRKNDPLVAELVTPKLPTILTSTTPVAVVV